MHKPHPVLENEKHKFLWDSEIQTDHLIPARRLDPTRSSDNKKTKKTKTKNNKKQERKSGNLPSSELYCSGRPQNEIKRKKKKREKYSDLAREVKKKAMEHEGAQRTGPKRLVRKLEEMKPSRLLVEVSKNTEKSSGDLK